MYLIFIEYDDDEDEDRRAFAIASDFNEAADWCTRANDYSPPNVTFSYRYTITVDDIADPEDIEYADDSTLIPTFYDGMFTD